MDAGTLSLKKLFSQDRRHLVPLFQRPYVWKQEKQWEPLWEDVRFVAERIVSGDTPRSHFLGAIVLDHVPKPTGEVETRLIIDGQQRTVSISQYVDGVFSYKDRYFHNLQQDEKDTILNYELTVYQCQGTDSAKLDWFRTINIAGEKLTDQELRNAVYAGAWTADAKRYFSKTQCAAWQLADKYMTGSPIRQEYLQTTISWINDGDIEGYMATHQHDPNANPLWLYFQAVISWVNATFPKYRREMKGIAWGALYNAHKDDNLDPTTLEAETARLMADDEVTKKKGVYEYLLTKNEKHLSIRAFTDSNKRTLYERQNGICPTCKEHFKIGEMEADHITPWSQGGKTELENGQMLCRECNRRKSNT